ncbi:MAG: DUF2950 domain-containing protein [Alphaproteobacteria bacterium]
MLRVRWHKPRTPRPLRLAALTLAATLAAASVAAPGLAAGAKPEGFASSEDAVTALVTAARADAPRDLLKVLGAAGRKLVYSGDPVADKEGRAKFVASYDEAHKIVADGDAKAVLDIGSDDWPFPIPLVKEANAWHFDTKAAEREILARRVGRNELNTIEVCRAYVEAQQEFASKDRLGDGLREYAMKFRSSPGKHDGLFWPANAGEEESPLGPLVASARAEGYGPRSEGAKPAPFHGYYFRILTRQGKDAPGGAYSYVVKGHMIGGFALVAFPAKYRDSGVTTFIVNQDGVVYQKDLGPKTADVARRMTAFDPDASWTKVAP